MPRSSANAEVEEEKEESLDLSRLPDVDQIIDNDFQGRSAFGESNQPIGNDDGLIDISEMDAVSVRGSSLGDLQVHTGETLNGIRKKKEKLKKKGKKKQAQDAEAIENDIARIDDTMKQVQGWNYTPVPNERRKPSKWRKFWSGVTNVAIKVTRAIVNVATAPVAAYKYFRANKTLARAEQRMQAAKNYEAIPGWDGATFEKKENETGEDILQDERRVPTVWSYVTAGKATESDGSPTPSEVTVYIQQPKVGSSEALSGTEIGHAMIGISYSRYSNVTKRNERYDLKYGFYPREASVDGLPAAPC